MNKLIHTYIQLHRSTFLHEPVRYDSTLTVINARAHSSWICITYYYHYNYNEHTLFAPNALGYPLVIIILPAAPHFQIRPELELRRQYLVEQYILVVVFSYLRYWGYVEHAPVKQRRSYLRLFGAKRTRYTNRTIRLVVKHVCGGCLFRRIKFTFVLMGC